jgi:CHAT domain-containing protein/Tfp pilus assembly protein PilF
MLRQGRLDEALLLLAEALERFSAGKERRWLTETRLHLSLLYHRLGDDALALEHARRAAALSPQDRDTRVRALRHLAELERRQGRLAEALSLYDRALGVFDPQQEDTERWITESERGEVILLQGDFERARAIQQGLLDTLPATEAPALAARIRYRLALGWLRDDRPDRARPLLESALTAFRSSGDVYYELLALEALAEALAANPRSQLEYSRQAVQLGFELRRQPLADARRVGVAAALERVEDRHVRLLVDRGRVDAAWAVAERVRSATLRQGQLARHRSRDETRRELLDRHAEMMDRLHRARLNESADSPERAVDPADLRLQIDIIESRLQKSPASAPPLATIGRDEVARALGARRLLVSYYRLPDRLLLWATSGDERRFATIDSADEITERIEALLDRLRHPRQAVGKIDELARDLGARLLGPVSDLIDSSETLLVQPHRELHALPFAVLIEDDRLLIDRLPVQQVLSIAARAESPPARARQRRLLVLADPGWQSEDRPATDLPEHSLAGRLMRDGVMARLPGTAREARALLEFESAGLEVDLRTGRRASRQFLEAGGLEDHALLHFATHGLVDMRYPSLSALLLADADGRGPALLRPSRIATLDLDAELVVLSGCETGAGPIPAGDGALSLARPFLIAGAEQVVSTLWKIDDARTAAFMAAFYRRLIEGGQDPARALAAAQRSMRGEQATAHPYFWAGFTVTGLALPD